MTQQPTIRCAGRERFQWESHTRAGRLAAAILAAGIERGDRVALLLRNDIEFLELSLAVASCGANPVPINWHWVGPEVEHVLRDSGARIVFAHTEFIPAVTAAIDGSGLDVVVVEVEMSEGLVDALGLDTLSATGRYETLEQWIAGQPEPLPYQEGAISDSMGLIYTSGTTGKPKGVAREKMTPMQLMSIAAGTANRMGLEAGGRMLVAGPLYHTSPNAVAVLALRMGTNIVIMPRFDAEQFLRHIDEDKIQQAKVVPTMLSRLLSLPDNVRDRYDVSSLTHLIHSAAPCPPKVKEQVIDWFGDAVTEFYGCTEAGTITWISATEWREHPGSVGCPADGSEVVIADDLGRQLVEPGKPGRVWVKGADYWPKFSYLNHDPEESPFPGLFTAGDEGYLDRDGFLYLTGRRSDIVISGGVNIYPVEIENAVIATGLAEDVAVFGIPDDEWGEMLVAHVILRPEHSALTADDLRTALTGALAGYKIPRRIDLVAELPREDSGKLFKAKLRL